MLIRSLNQKPKGRSALSKALELSESTTRTMLKTLRSKKLIKTTTLGHTLTKKGKELTGSINSRISYPKILDIRTYTMHDNNIGYTIRNPEKNITDSGAVTFRDSAIKMGADGLISMAQYDNLELIGKKEIDIEPPKAIKEQLNPKKGDIILITFAEKKITSELAGLKIALDLIGFRLDI
ncbi:MAG: DUF4443 domain-containing protein [archaeon]